MAKVIICISLMFMVGSALAQEPAALTTDRYTSLAMGATKSQLEPLEVVVQIKFPKTVYSTEQAVNYLLEDSGYSLVDKSLWTEEMQIMLSHSIAALHRDMKVSPMSLTQVLNVLSGTHFRVVKDPLRRKISFVLLEEYKGLIHD